MENLDYKNKDIERKYLKNMQNNHFYVISLIRGYFSIKVKNSLFRIYGSEGERVER